MAWRLEVGLFSISRYPLSICQELSTWTNMNPIQVNIIEQNLAKLRVSMSWHSK